MAVSKRTRFEVLRRDNYTCRYCRSTDNPLTVDHVLPISLGGTDDPTNLVACCKDCNAGKASSAPDAPLVAQVADDAMRFAAHMRAAMIARSLDLEDRHAERAAFREAWSVWAYSDGTIPPLPNDWETTIDQWNSLGAGLDLQKEAIRLAMTHRNVRDGDEFRYAAGVIWNMIREAR